MDFDDSEEEIVDDVEEIDDDAETSSEEEENTDEDNSSDDMYVLDPMEIKQHNDYPVIKIVLPPGQRRTSKDFLDQVETAQLIATFAQMISEHDYMPPIDTGGHDTPRDIAIKAIMERGLDRKKQTIPYIIERRLPAVVNKTNGKIIQYVEHINPNDTSIAIPFLPPLKELYKSL